LPERTQHFTAFGYPKIANAHVRADVPPRNGIPCEIGDFKLATCWRRRDALAYINPSM
jgi:hypothetical protein